MSLTTRVLVGLAAGLAAGVAIAASGQSALTAIVPVIEPLGTLWVNAIRMTVIPLVVSLLIVGIASSDARAIGRVGGRAVILFLAMLAASAALAVLVVPPLLGGLRIDPASTAALRESAAGAAVEPQAMESLPSASEWLLSLVPTNPVRTAADGAMLPLIVFSLALALAATRIAPELRQALVRFFEALGGAMLVLVHWILLAAPVGVFALALPLAQKLGVAAAGALIYYVVLVSAVCFLAIVLLYPTAALLGGARLSAFLRAAAPAQSVALSSRSSLAALPALIEEAETRLRLPPSVTGFFLPLAVSTFRLTAPIAILTGSLFLARLYGVGLGAGQVATIAVMAVFLSFSIPGIPGGTILTMVPALLAVGVPAGGVGILLAVDTIPDMLRTTTHVTADLAVAVLLSRGRREAAVGTGTGAAAPLLESSGATPAEGGAKAAP
ncbi:MAG: dicarboxylate/amino acid:cation symporter [Gemmatimonadetes bacterium]|nr:dicarboxylate/amino acid:cation symporter [Gemmatimonadota bacterium]